MEGLYALNERERLEAELARAHRVATAAQEYVDLMFTAKGGAAIKSLKAALADYFVEVPDGQS